MSSTNAKVFAALACLAALFWQVSIQCKNPPKKVTSHKPRGEIMFEWLTVEFDWPTQAMKEQYIRDGRYIPSHNLPIGIKTYKKQVYLSVPRVKYTYGVPSTLNTVVMKDGKPVLRPFPDWESQELGNCAALQCAMSMEVDPITGYMYVIDPGRSGIFKNDSEPEPVLCPPKIVVYDLHDGSLVRSHDLPERLVHKATNFLDDIVIDRGNRYGNTARWVYITDAGDTQLIAFDLETNTTTTFYHPSMEADPGQGSNIVVKGRTYKLAVPIDGIAMSSDFEYVYYCALGNKNLYQVPSRALRYHQDFKSQVRFVGRKVSQTGGMMYGSKNLYYGAVTKNAVYRWEVANDKKNQRVDESLVKMKTHTEVLRDDEKMEWPDSFTIDEDGYLWFTANRAQIFFNGNMDFSGASGPNHRIWRVKVGENSYLAPKYSDRRFG